MPSLQVVDLSPSEPNQAQQNLEKFFSKLGSQYKEEKSNTKMDELIAEYDQTKDKALALDKLQLAIHHKDVAPSKRLEMQNTINNMTKVNAANQMQVAKKIKQDKLEEEKKEKSERAESETKIILEDSGYTPEEIEKLKTISPQSARVLSQKKKEGEEYSKLREKSISEYVNTALEEEESAESQKFAISEARKAVKGDVTGPGFTAMLKNNPHTQLYMGLTTDESKLQAANKKMLEGAKGLFGPRPTEREIFLLLNEMLPSIGKTREANEAGLDFIEKVNDMKLVRAQIVSKETNGGSKYVPNIEQKVNEQMRPLRDALLSELQEAKEKFSSPEKKKEEGKKVKGKAPDGKYYNFPASEIESAKKDGVIFE